MASVSLVYSAPYSVIKHHRIALVSKETRVVESRWPIESSRLPFLNHACLTPGMYTYTCTYSPEKIRENCSENVRAASEGRGSIIEKCEVEGSCAKIVSRNRKK